MKRLLLFVLLTSAFIYTEPGDWISTEDKRDIKLQHYIIEADGTEKDLYTFENDINRVLEQENLILNHQDYVNIRCDNDTYYVKINRCMEKFITETAQIPYQEEIQYSLRLGEDFSKTIQNGQDGLKEVKYRVTLQNGQELRRESISEVIIKEPQPQIILKGQRAQAVIASGRPTHFREVKIMEASAYTHTGNRTATGVYPEIGTIAVDPEVIPLGTKLWIEGYGFGVAQDTGGYINGNRIDLFMETKRECFYWGRRHVRVLILE
ncbi:MAG: 3D domain-containing protein [Peptococcaceae bacterium]